MNRHERRVKAVQERQGDRQRKQSEAALQAGLKLFKEEVKRVREISDRWADREPARDKSDLDGSGTPGQIAVLDDEFATNEFLMSMASPFK